MSLLAHLPRSVRFAVCRREVLFGVLLLASLSITSPVYSQSLTWLGRLGGYPSFARDVSNNGVVVGFAGETDVDFTDFPSRAFRYQNGVMEDLGALIPGNESVALGISADGRIIVGYSEIQDEPYDPDVRAFRWENGTMVSLTDIQDPTVSVALGISNDGSVIVGRYGYNAVYWRDGQMQVLPALGSFDNYALDVSADGSVIVGASNDQPVYWVDGQVYEIASSTRSAATGVSADGSVIVGYYRPNFGDYRAFRFVNGILTDLGTLGGRESFATDVSADGRIVVGVAATDGFDRRAFLWTAEGGMQNLNLLYSSLLQGQSYLVSASAISPNGRYIVGVGYNSATRDLEAFLLDTVPEPASLLALLGFGGAWLTLQRRRR